LSRLPPGVCIGFKATRRTGWQRLNKEAGATVLTITPQALAVIQRVTGHPALERSSGVRIARRQDPAARLEVRAVHRPQPRDRVVERGGGRLYLSPEAAQHVEGAELDAVTDADERVQFVLRAPA
jgi:Fe-S cluster assembly iron-binding protein IscA